MCNFQELNYTLLVENKSGSPVTKLGPISKVGSGFVKENIVSENLKANQVYSLKVHLDVYSQVATSNKHNFSKIQCQLVL